MIDSPAIILAFPPGGYGFLLGKWLINNRLAQPLNLASYINNNFNFDPDKTNHDYVPYYFNELITLHGPSLIQDQLNLGILDSSTIKDFGPTELPKLIHSHVGSELGLNKLAEIFTNARIIKVIVTREEAIACNIRKSKNIENAGKNIMHYAFYEFIDLPGPDINVKLSQILNLHSPVVMMY